MALITDILYTDETFLLQILRTHKMLLQALSHLTPKTYENHMRVRQTDKDKNK